MMTSQELALTLYSWPIETQDAAAILSLRQAQRVLRAYRPIVVFYESALSYLYPGRG